MLELSILGLFITVAIFTYLHIWVPRPNIKIRLKGNSPLRLQPWSYSAAYRSFHAFQIFDVWIDDKSSKSNKVHKARLLSITPNKNWKCTCGMCHMPILELAAHETKPAMLQIDFRTNERNAVYEGLCTFEMEFLDVNSRKWRFKEKCFMSVGPFEKD